MLHALDKQHGIECIVVVVVCIFRTLAANLVNSDINNKKSHYH